MEDGSKRSALRRKGNLCRTAKALPAQWARAAGEPGLCRAVEAKEYEMAGDTNLLPHSPEPCVCSQVPRTQPSSTERRWTSIWGPSAHAQQGRQRGGRRAHRKVSPNPPLSFMVMRGEPSHRKVQIRSHADTLAP